MTNETNNISWNDVLESIVTKCREGYVPSSDCRRTLGDKIAFLYSAGCDFSLTGSSGKGFIIYPWGRRLVCYGADSSIHTIEEAVEIAYSEFLKRDKEEV